MEIGEIVKDFEMAMGSEASVLETGFLRWT